jgi:two-component system response regulator AlgR
MIVDDEPLAVERLQMLCAREPRIALVGTATDGEAALRLIEGLKPDLVMLDIAMPLLDGIGVARAVGRMGIRPAVIFVTAFEGFAVEAFDLAAVDYLLKPVAHDRLTRAIDRVEMALRHQSPDTAPAISSAPQPEWAEEFWVPHRSELIRIATDQIDRIEAERDYMRLHVGGHSYLLHQTISSLEERLDPQQFVRLDHIARLRHDGSGVWFAALADGGEIRIGRTFLANARAMTGR